MFIILMDDQKHTVKMINMTFRDYQKEVIQKLKPILYKLGFQKSEKTLTSFHKESSTNIDFLVLGNYGKTLGNLDYYKFFIVGGRKLKLVEDYWEDFRINPLAKDNPINWKNIQQSTFWISPIDKWGECATIIEFSPETESNALIEKTCSHILNQYLKVIAPRLTKYSDINLLDNIENNNGVKDELHTPMISQGNGYWFRKLIIARLAGNENYFEIYETIRKKFEKSMKKELSKSNKNQLWVLNKLNERLQNIKPLENE